MHREVSTPIAAPLSARARPAKGRLWRRGSRAGPGSSPRERRRCRGRPESRTATPRRRCPEATRRGCRRTCGSCCRTPARRRACLSSRLRCPRDPCRRAARRAGDANRSASRSPAHRRRSESNHRPPFPLCAATLRPGGRRRGSLRRTPSTPRRRRAPESACESRARRRPSPRAYSTRTARRRCCRFPRARAAAATPRRPRPSWRPSQPSPEAGSAWQRRGRARVRPESGCLRRADRACPAVHP